MVYLGLKYVNLQSFVGAGLGFEGNSVPKVVVVNRIVNVSMDGKAEVNEEVCFNNSSFWMVEYSWSTD